MRRSLTALVLVGLFVGCTEPELASVKSEASAAQTRVNDLRPGWVKPEHAADIQTRAEVGNEAAQVFFGAVEEHGWSDWQALDAVARAPGGVDPEHQYLVDQFLSREMLRIIGESCTEGCDEARAYHVERLLEAGHPDAAALEGYLAQLEGHWSAKRIAEARRLSAAHAEVWLARHQQRSAKRDCGPGEECGAYVDAQEEATRNIIAAAERLRAN